MGRVEEATGRIDHIHTSSPDVVQDGGLAVTQSRMIDQVSSSERGKVQVVTCVYKQGHGDPTASTEG